MTTRLNFNDILLHYMTTYSNLNYQHDINLNSQHFRHIKAVVVVLILEITGEASLVEIIVR